jgi:putative ATPase
MRQWLRPSCFMKPCASEMRHVESAMPMSLFAKLDPEASSGGGQPLAERMRPRTLDEFTGQESLLGPGKPLRTQIERDDIGSMILWGPPGCGKTTLARLIARMTQSEFAAFSAVLTGIKEIKEVMAAAEHSRRGGRRTIVFIDEVHRFNKAQQDAFLPHVEAGNITLIGATTENPSFEVIAPLLSRTRVYVLQALSTEQIDRLLRRALEDRERGLGNENLAVSDEAIQQIAVFSGGDARAAYNTLDACAPCRPTPPENESSRAKCWPSFCSANSCSTTRAAKSITI